MMMQVLQIHMGHELFLRIQKPVKTISKIINQLQSHLLWLLLIY